MLVDQLVHALDTKFVLQDLGLLNYFWEFKSTISLMESFLTQTTYIDDVLHKLNLSNLKPTLSPSILGKRLSISDDQPMVDPFLYRSIVGALQYLTNTHSNIAYIVNHLSQFLKQPTDVHWQAVKRVIRYLSGTKTMGLLIQLSDQLSIYAYLDADWALNLDDRKWVAAYCVFLGNTLISWSSKKQIAVARSNTESEYGTLAHASTEIIWLRQLLREIGLPIPFVPVLWCGNISVGSLATNPVFHARSKHIEIDVHFV